MLSDLIEFLKKRRAERKDAANRSAIARAFNDRYCYRNTYKPIAAKSLHFGRAWMCPECNAIHEPYENSVWTGLQYPACCTTFAGDRLNHGIKTR
jgi:hypothetical protein